MNKRLLSKVKRPVLPKDFHTKHNENLILTAEIRIIEHNKIFILNIFTDKDFEEKLYYNKKLNFYFPFVRIFLGKSEYITQNLRTDKTKWYTGKISKILEFFSFSDYNKTNTMFADEDTLYKASKFFNMKEFAFKSAEEIYTKINCFQNNIAYEKLMKKYRCKFYEIDSYMKQLKKLPRNFNKWTETAVLNFSRYIIYDYNKNRRYFNAYCTHCNSDILLDGKDPEVKHNKMGYCPACKSKITYKARKKFPQVKYDYAWCSIFQKTKDNKFVLRSFKVGKFYFGRGEKLNYETCVSEVCRTFFYDNKFKSFENYYVSKLQYYGWYFDVEKYHCGRSVLYEKNIKSLIKGTPYQYSALERITEDFYGKPFFYWFYILKYEENKYWEYLVKLKLYNLLSSIMNNWYYESKEAYIDEDQKSIMGILGLNRKEFSILKKLDGDVDLLQILQNCRKYNREISIEEIKIIWKYNKINIRLQEYCEYITANELISFLERECNMIMKEDMYCDTDRFGKYFEKKINTIQEVLKDWNDYRLWCEELGCNIKNKKLLLPSDFYAEHDRMSNKYADYLRIKCRTQNKKIHFMLMDALERDRKYTFEYKNLVLLVPRSEGDFKKESRELKHCVKTYITKVAEGKSKIFFIRHINEIKKPFYTMEYMNGNVIQCRGYRNCGIIDEVNEFIDKFLIRARKIEYEDPIA